VLVGSDAVPARGIDVSVIVPSYNSSATIGRCLASIIDQSVDFAYEIIVVDSSTDRTRDVVAEQFPQVRMISLEQKTIPSTARNIGIRSARGRVLMFTDSDCIADRDWIKTLLSGMDRGYRLVGGGIRNARRWNLVSIAEYFLEFRDFSYRSRARVTDMIPTCNLAVRREVFDELGLFPEIRASEDRMFMMKVVTAGERGYFEPMAVISHMNRDRIGPYVRNQVVLGCNGSIARRIDPRIPGSRFARHLSLALSLPILRTGRTLQRILSGSSLSIFIEIAEFLLVSPLFLLGMFAWGYGFVKGMYVPISERIAEYEARK